MGLCVELGLGLKAELELGLGFGLEFGWRFAQAENLWVVMSAGSLPRSFLGRWVRLTEHRLRRKISQWEPRPNARRGLGETNT